MRGKASVIVGLILCGLLAAGATCGSAATPASGAETLGKPTVLVFGLGPRCRYCVQLKKEIGRVTEETGDAVQFRDVLVDHDKAMVQRYRVLLSPTLVFLDATGAEADRHQGILDAQQILERLIALRLWAPPG